MKAVRGPVDSGVYRICGKPGKNIQRIGAWNVAERRIIPLLFAFGGSGGLDEQSLERRATRTPAVQEEPRVHDCCGCCARAGHWSELCGFFRGQCGVAEASDLSGRGSHGEVSGALGTDCE